METRPYVQYEIRCHILSRDPFAFQTRAPDNLHFDIDRRDGNDDDVHHRSWSVWRRYSELSSLDGELRRDFGWQMDTLDDGRGVTFTSSRDLEIWWYGFSNGSGSGSRSLYGMFRTTTTLHALRLHPVRGAIWKVGGTRMTEMDHRMAQRVATVRIRRPFCKSGRGNCPRIGRT